MDSGFSTRKEVADSNYIPIVDDQTLDEFYYGSMQKKYHKDEPLFYVNRVEDARERFNFPISPHRKTVYDILFLTKGEGVCFKGLTKYHYRQNQVFSIPAYQITVHESISNDASGFFVHFSPELFSENLHLLKRFNFLQFNADPIVTIPAFHLQPILNIFNRLLDFVDDKSNQRSNAIKWYLMALFSEVNHHISTSPREVKDSAALVTQKFKDALSQYIYTHHTLKDFAKLLHITPNHLNKCVKKTLNKTAQSLLNEMLILEAKSLLRFSPLTVSEISHTLHRSSSSNFSRFFKRETGITPTKYLQAKLHADD